MRRASEPIDAAPTASFRSSRAVTFTEAPTQPAASPRGGRFRGPSESGRDDPSVLLKDFDSKLQSIQEVLSRYQSERTTQGRGGAAAGAAAAGRGGAAAGGGGPGGATGAGGAGDHHAHGHAHGHDPRVGSAPSSARRWQPHGQGKGGGGGGHEGGQQQGGQLQPQLSAQQQKRMLNPANVMDEEVFVRRVLATPRRVKSAVPGASRALSARIEYYRCHRDKAQEKADRAREELMASQREAAAAAGAAGCPAGPAINFVEANRRSIVPCALPPSLQLTIESLRESALSNLAAASPTGRGGGGGGGGGAGAGVGGSSSRRGGGTPSTVCSGWETNRSTSRPWSGLPTPFLRAGAGSGAAAAAAAAGAGGPYSVSVSPAPTPAGAAANGGYYTSRTVTPLGAGGGGGGGGGGLGADWLQPAFEPEWEAGGGGVQRSGASGSSATRPGGGAAAGSRPPTAGGRHSSWDGSADGDGGNAGGEGGGGGGGGGGGRRSGVSSPSIFLTTLESAPSARASFVGPRTSMKMAGPPSPVGGANGDKSPTGDRSRSPTAAAAAGIAAARQGPPATSSSSRPGTAAAVNVNGSAGSALVPYGMGANGVAWRASTNSPSVVSGGTGDGGSYGSVGSGVDTRRLRLALSARPASGGSPTKRMDFIAEHAARRVERAIYAAEVRERAAALDAERRRHIVAAAEQRAAARRDEEARQAAAKALAERQERQRQWTGIVGLCSKLSFLAERVLDDRRVRALRALRKEAAVKIATWYKGILLRRRQVELVSLIQRLRHLLRPYLALQRVLVRQRCAARIVSFLEFTSTSNMAVVGVRRLKAEVEVLQTAWRNALLVRSMQRSILYNQLTRLEREVVAANRRAERSAANQMVRLGKSVNILEPDGGLLPTSTRSFRHMALAGTSFRNQQQQLTAASGGQHQHGGGQHQHQQHQHQQHQHQQHQQHQHQQHQQAAAAAGVSGYDALAIIPANDAGGGGGAATARGGLGVGVGGSTRGYDRLRQPGRGVLLHEAGGGGGGGGGGEEEEESLRGHLEMVPREVREQVVNSFLLDARREHRKLLEQYSNEKMLYQARKPIEEMRQKMLRDAGLTVEPEVKPPVMPHMRLVYPRPKLRELLRRAVEINAARLAAAEERRQQEAAEREAGRGGGGGGGHWLSGDRGGGVLWADLAGGGLDRNLSRGGPRRSISRTSVVLRGTSHRRLPPSGS